MIILIVNIGIIFTYYEVLKTLQEVEHKDS